MVEWYIAKVKPRNERNVEANLGRRGTEVYSPEITVTRRGVSCIESLFPGYVFIRTDPLSDGWPLVRWTRGVSYFLPAETNPISVSDSIVDDIRCRVSRWNSVEWSVSFQAGDHVLIDSGPLRSLDAIFQRYVPGNRRCEVLVFLMGRSQPVNINVTDLNNRIERQQFGVLEGSPNSEMVPTFQ